MREPLPTDELDTQSFSADPLTEAIRRADLAALWRAIAELPRQQRDALLLREFGGLSYEELAEALAVTGPAVESLLFRARQGVRARLQTAYAALTGVGWVETLVRLLAGASSSAAPVAAKAVVVAGVVATGGVVVAPHVFDHPRAVRTQAAHALQHVVHVTHAERTAAPAAPIRVLVAAHPAVKARGGGESDTAAGAGAHASGSGEGRQGQRGNDSGDHESRHAAAAGNGKQESDSSGSDGADDSPPPPAEQPPAQPAPASAGLTASVPNPPVTIAALPGDEPPASGD